MSSPFASLKKSKRPPLLLPEMVKTPTPTPSHQGNNSSRLSPIIRGNDSKEAELFSPSNATSPFTSVSSLNSGYSQSLLSNNKYWNNTSNPPSSRVPFKSKSKKKFKKKLEI